MKRKHTLSVLLAVLVLTTFACSLPGMGGSADSLPDGLTENYAPAPGSTPLQPYAYSQDQQTVQQLYGSPTRFTIVFSESIRQETWTYDTAGYTVVFRNGVKVSEQTVKPEYREGMFATTYTPAIFSQGMGINEIVLATGRQDFVLTSMEGMVEEGRLMHLEGLSVGLKDGQVLFVETIPALTETPLYPQDFPD